MAKLVVNDIFEELRQENKRLLNDLIFSQKCVEFLENYRNCLKDFNINCICEQNIINKNTFNSLEDQYNSVFIDSKPKYIETNLLIDSEVTERPVISKRVGNKRQKYNSKTFEDFDSDSSDSSDDSDYGYNEPNIKVKPKEMLCGYMGCKARFETKRALNEHISSCHTIEKPFKCLECSQTFTAEKSLKQHLMTTHNKERKFECSQPGCTFVTQYPGNLRQHMLIHKNVRNFKCDENGCGKSFPTNSKLKRHRLHVHCNERPHPCDWPGCEFRFKTKQNLDNHRLLHLNERTVKCDFEGCDKYFVTRKQLYKHKSRHRNLCHWPGCGQSLESNPALISHMNRHQNVRPFKCEVSGCEQNFYGKPELNQHLKLGHKVPPIVVSKTSPQTQAFRPNPERQTNYRPIINTFPQGLPVPPDWSMWHQSN